MLDKRSITWGEWTFSYPFSSFWWRGKRCVEFHHSICNASKGGKRWKECLYTKFLRFLRFPLPTQIYQDSCKSNIYISEIENSSCAQNIFLLVPPLARTLSYIINAVIHLLIYVIHIMFKRISFESRLIVIWVRIKDSAEDTAGVVGTCVFIYENMRNFDTRSKFMVKFLHNLCA